MAGRHKRKLEDFDPNKSDSDDLDYGADSSPRPQHRSSRKAKTPGSRKPAKRRREGYGDSDDDIEIDSDAESGEEESFPEDSQEEQAEVNPRTGRSVRSVAKKPVKYEEESDEEIEAPDSDSEAAQRPSRARRGTTTSPPRQSLIVKLKTGGIKMEGGRATRSRTGSKAVAHSSRNPTPEVHGGLGTRRSSRISHSEEQPLVMLTDSGKHEIVTRAATMTPEPESSRRPTRGGKSLGTIPSAIYEVSQEDSQQHQEEDDTQFVSQLAEAVGMDDEPMIGLTTAGAMDVEADTTADALDEIQMEQVVQESDADDDDAPVARGSGRSLRARRRASTPPTSQPQRRSLRQKKSSQEQSSDFEPDAEGEDEADAKMSSEDDLLKPTSRGRSSNDESTAGRRSGRLSRKARASTRSRARSRRSEDEADEDLDPDEILDEAADLEEDHRERARTRPRKGQAKRTEGISFETSLRSRGNKPDYRIIRPELMQTLDDDDLAAAPAQTPQRNRRAGGAGGGFRSLFSTLGPFGGAGGPAPVFGGLPATGAVGDVDSDSSDDEAQMRGGQQGLGGMAGMTPTSAVPKPFVPQAHNTDPIQGPGGGPPGLGKVKDKKALADADPLGVDPNVSFEGVGGLDDHIDRLKEMVALPLLYPEIFMRFHVTPPRGVLFHGPPGTGKTLLARALASSVSSQGKKVTFYMRKGADALSKWVGEAEKQLRLLFEEARKNQPSIIFFDEIDGLAPVRSSKQEQIHASIVATLLALMDGMDGRGQVIVIGATNRPDSVDPALRRPGRFDREFYFALPDQKARRAILDIHTKGWDPPLQPAFKDNLAELTRGYGGADLRALCTEAALNAVQGTYPQIYSSDKKLVIDPSTIKVTAKDFMISVNKIIPSSERSAASGAAPIKKDIEPLLRKPLSDIMERVNEAIPRKRKATALEEAMYDDRDDDDGFERENMARQFEAGRIFRPRLLIKGLRGMGQQYLGAALLSKLEGLHVQNFDMATLMKDSTRSPEAAVIQQFEEVKRHKPSVIYIPNVDIWYRTLDRAATRTFAGLLRSIPPTEPVLLLGVMETEDDPDQDEETKRSVEAVQRELFGFSYKNQYEVERPGERARMEYFRFLVDYIRKAPNEFPDPEKRKRRKLVELPVAQASEDPKGPTKADLKAQKKKDRLTLNMLKSRIQVVMDQIKLKHKRFRFPIVPDTIIGYLYDEQNPKVLTTDLGEVQRQEQQLFRPYELDQDEKGVPGLREVASGKFYYNMEIVTIENRLSNGYYKRPKDFLADIKRLAKDAKTSGDSERTLKANEMLANVEVDMAELENTLPALAAECENVYQREQAREKERLEKVAEAEQQGQEVPKIVPNVPPVEVSKTTTESSGPVVLGQEVPSTRPHLFPVTPSRLSGSNPVSNAWSTTNGSGPSHHTNGSTVPSRPHEDSEMMDSEPDGSAHTDPNTSNGYPQHSALSQAATQGQRSQRGAHTQIAYGSQPGEYHNSASTTTSGQKTSDRSSGRYTQASNGTRGEGPDFASLPPVTGGSQLPDTQDPSSQSQQSPSSPQMAPPPLSSRASNINALLNTDADGETEIKPTLVFDPNYLTNLHSAITEASSGLSVEQLEQVSASLMDVLWRTRGDWNRNRVIAAVKETFNEVVKDIEACQKVQGPSQKVRI